MTAVPVLAQQGPPPGGFSGTSGGGVGLWGSRTLLDLKLAQLTCATDPACLDRFQGEIDFHATSGAPRIRIDLSAGTSATPLLDWAASHPSAVSLEQRTVTEAGISTTRLVVSIAGPDPQALGPGLVAAAASLEPGSGTLWTPEPALTAGLHADLSTLSSAFGACQGDAACIAGLEAGRPWFEADGSAATLSLAVRANATASNVPAIQSWLSGLGWAATPRILVVQAPTLTRVVAIGPLQASTLTGLPQQAFLTGKEWHTRPLRDEELTDSWLRLDGVGATVAVERCGGPPPCEDGSNLPVPAVLDAGGRVLARVAPRTGGATALDAFTMAGWTRLGAITDAFGTVHVVGWATADALVEIGRGLAVAGGLTVTLGIAGDLYALGLDSGPEDLSFLMDGPVAFWGTATLLEMIAAERMCMVDPNCLSYYQGRVAFDPVTGAPQLRVTLPPGEDAGTVNAWATRHPDRVRVLELWVEVEQVAHTELLVSVAGEDDGALWMELMSDLSTGLAASTDADITPEPLRAPGAHGDVLALLDQVEACASDPACIEPLADGRAWFDVADMTAALELAVAADPSGSDAAVIAQNLAAMAWAGPVALRTVDTPLGVRVEAQGRLSLAALEDLGQEPALSSRPWSSRPQRAEEVTGARLAIAAVVTADQVRTCLEEPECVPGQDYPLPAVVETDGRILARLEPASGSPQALLDYTTLGWTGLADESTSTGLVVVGWVTWDAVDHFGLGGPVVDGVVPAGLDLLLGQLDDLPISSDDDIASDDDAGPPPDDDNPIGDDDIAVDDDVTVGDDDIAVGDDDVTPGGYTYTYAATAYTFVEGPRPGDCPTLTPRRAWFETTTPPDDGLALTDPSLFDDPDVVNGDPSSATYPQLTDEPTRSVLEDYYVCRHLTDLAVDPAVDVPRWCPPVGVEEDWYALARMLEREVTDVSGDLAPVTIGGQTITRYELRFDTPMVVLASLRETVARPEASRWRTATWFDITLRTRVNGLSAQYELGTGDAVAFGGSVSVQDDTAVLDIPVRIRIGLEDEDVGLLDDWFAHVGAWSLPNALLASAEVDAPQASWAAEPVLAYGTGNLDATGQAEAAEALRTSLARAVAESLSDETDSFALSLGRFLGPYTFAVNDLFGCPGTEGPSCVVPGPTWPEDDPSGSYWHHEDITHPTIQAVLPAEPALDAVGDPDEAGCGRGDWRDSAGTAFVLHIASDSMVGMLPDPTASTFGDYGLFALSAEDLASGAGTSVSDYLDSLRDVEAAAHPLSDSAGLGELLTKVVRSTIDLTVAHNDPLYCDQKYEIALGAPGEEIGDCRGECRVIASDANSLASGDNLAATASLFGFDPADPDSLETVAGALDLFELMCKAECLEVERDLRDHWARTCRDSNTVALSAPVGSDECAVREYDADGDGRAMGREYCIDGGGGEVCAPGPFTWELVAVDADGNGDTEGYVPRVYEAECAGGTSPEAIGPLDLDGDGEADGPEVVDPDCDGFPNHLDPVSFTPPGIVADYDDYVAMDGTWDHDLTEDNHTRFSYTQEVSLVPVLVPFAPPLPVVPWLLPDEPDEDGNPQFQMTDDCVRLAVSDVHLYAPYDGLEPDVPILENGDGDPEPALELGMGGKYGLETYVPVITMTDQVVLHGRADLSVLMDLVILDPPPRDETCDGTFSDPTYSGTPDAEFTYRGIDVQLPLTLKWEFPLAEDRRWAWATNWVQNNRDAPGLVDFLHATFTGAALDEQAVMSQVKLTVTAGTPSLTPPPWTLFDVQCIGWPGCVGGIVLEHVETDCDDGLDEDGDGIADCEDSDCTGNPHCWIDGVADTDIIRLYVFNALLKPEEDFGGWGLGGIGIDPMDEIESRMEGSLDPFGTGSLLEADVPYFDSVSFWLGLRNSEVKMPGFGQLDELQILPPVLRALPRLAEPDIQDALGLLGFDIELTEDDIQSLGLGQFLGPQVRLLLVDAAALEPGGEADSAGPTDGEALRGILDALRPEGTVSGVRSGFFENLKDDIASEGFVDGTAFDLTQALYAGWLVSDAVDEDWQAAGPDVPGAEWDGGLFLAFYRLKFPDAPIPDPAEERHIWEWRAVTLPTMTPGAYGQ